MLSETEAAGKVLGVQIESAEVRNAPELEETLSVALKRGSQTVIVLPSPMLAAERSRLVDFSAQRRLPTMYPWREAVNAGGLVSYGPKGVDVYRRAAVFIDKILKGAKPADLPVEQPTAFEFVINVKIAKARGLMISALAAGASGSADRVMDRRRFLLTSIAGVLTAPLSAEGQQARRRYRIGILGNVPPTEPYGAQLWGAFVRGLGDLGYAEGQNISIEQLYSEGKYDRLVSLADELVRRRVDIIVVPADQNAIAARQATRTIPIVMIGDPVGSGLVASLARPGGNITGLSSLVGPEIIGKQLEFLKAMVPQLSRVAILRNPRNPLHAALVKEARNVAPSMALEVQTVEAQAPDDFQPAFAAMVKDHVGAVLVVTDGMFGLHPTRIADLAAKSRLPTMGTRIMVEAGVLMTYGPNGPDLFRRAATYVDKILKGAKTADLPIERPTEYELVINLKTAKALGLTIPPSLLARADQVIE